MPVVVIVESIVLVVLAIFVAGLLASYADVRKRLEALEKKRSSISAISASGGVTGVEAAHAMRSVPAEPGAEPPEPEEELGHLQLEQPQLDQGDTGLLSVIPTPAASANQVSRRIADLAGVTPEGDRVAIAVAGVAHQTLIAFLSSGCRSCKRFWAQLADPDSLQLPDHVRVVVVTKGVDAESPAAIAELCEPVAPGIAVVMSSEAWRDCGVPGTPYFVSVDGPTGWVRGEGTALDWQGVIDLLILAGGDLSSTVGRPPPSTPFGGTGWRPKSGSDLARERQIDRILLEAGITPGHPSLYPTRSDAAASSPQDPDPRRGDRT